MKKFLRTLFILILTIVISLPYSLSVKATIIPKLQVVTQPKGEYTPSEKISFTVWNPNYIYNVEYRVILYNGTTKKTTNLWNTPNTGYYYRGWQPAGTYKFTIQWNASQLEPGPYSMTVLVRRKNSSTKYDSYIDTKSFWIRSAANNNSGNTSTNTDNTDNIFIPNETVNRVSIVDAKPTLDYSDKTKYGKLYYTRGIYLTATRTTNYGKYDTIHDNIMYLANNSSVPHIYYGDKDYTVCLGWRLAQINTEENLNQMQYAGLFDNNNQHNFEVYLYEVFYDSNTNQYYFANEKHTELQGATIKKDVPNKVGTVPKYIAIPVTIVDPR